MRETDLFQPVRQYLLHQGYDVSAEVKDCDVVATRGAELIVIELKTTANIRLLIQAVERQKVTPSVYVALPEPGRRNSHFRGVEHLLRRLGLGLMTVRFGPLGPAVIQCFEPAPLAPAIQPNKQNAVLQEIAGRSESLNVGGSNNTKIMTAYRETALFIACCLERLGPCTPGALRALGTGERTTSILSKNYYGWFERVSRGVYRVTRDGIAASHRYPALRTRALARLAGPGGQRKPPST